MMAASGEAKAREKRTRPRPPEARPIFRNIKHRFGILLPVWVRHLGNRRRTTARSRKSQPFRNRSTNNEDMTDFRNFR